MHSGNIKETNYFIPAGLQQANIDFRFRLSSRSILLEVNIDCGTAKASIYFGGISIL